MGGWRFDAGLSAAPERRADASHWIAFCDRVMRKSGFAAFLELELKRRGPRRRRLAERRAKMEKRRRNESREALSVLFVEGPEVSTPGRSSPRLGRRKGGPFWENRSSIGINA